MKSETGYSKKLLFVLILIVTSGIIYAQNIPSYPIPSYNVTVDPLANFRETTSTPSGNGDEKKVLVVQIKSKEGCEPYSAQVWVYTLDYSTMLGPYTVMCGETLYVEIDEREWGLIIRSEGEVLADVWIQ